MYMSCWCVYACKVQFHTPYVICVSFPHDTGEIAESEKCNPGLATHSCCTCPLSKTCEEGSLGCHPGLKGKHCSHCVALLTAGSDHPSETACSSRWNPLRASHVPLTPTLTRGPGRCGHQPTGTGAAASGLGRAAAARSWGLDAPPRLARYLSCCRCCPTSDFTHCCAWSFEVVHVSGILAAHLNHIVQPGCRTGR